jgi:hypothetical protein
MKIFEGLEQEDLKGLVFDIISIDQYKPKIGSDAEAVVVAFTVKYEEPANDLANFIQTSYIELLDVEASTVPNEEGFYKVFVEFDRTPNLYKKISQLLHDINKITGTDGGEWKYVAYKMITPRVFTKENLEKNVIFTSQEYDSKYKKKTAEDSVRERIEFLLKY